MRSDILAPDLYLEYFDEVCDRFTRNGNPLFIPETGTNVANVLTAFGKYGANRPRAGGEAAARLRQAPMEAAAILIAAGPDEFYMGAVAASASRSPRTRPGRQPWGSASCRKESSSMASRWWCATSAATISVRARFRPSVLIPFFVWWSTAMNS